LDLFERVKVIKNELSGEGSRGVGVAIGGLTEGKYVLKFIKT
jgi:hypothetical protein